MKKLKEIISSCKILLLEGNSEVFISSIIFDSRKIEKDCLFVAIKGTQSDGHQYINSAIENGAIAIVCENIPTTKIASVTYIQVENTTKSLGHLAAAFYDFPSSKLKLTGVTGTNGKTTTATLLYHMFRKAGYKVGLISTVIYYIDEKPIEATHTTPDVVVINKLLHDMVISGCSYAFMEVSSHAIDQYRIEGLNFVVAIFTNITHDHLDYHKTFDEYIRVKKSFFDNLSENAYALSNIDDKNGKVMLQNTKAIVKKYALKSKCDFNCKILEEHIEGMLLNINNAEVWTHFIGDFNASNLVAVYGASILLGLEKEFVLKTLSQLKPVNGRFEYFISNEGVTAIVDYAHTPDALVNVLNTINKLVKDNASVITVVGAGGNRDKLKRPKMAKISVDMSNKVILTSDNPRNEEIQDILNDMLQGIPKEEMKRVLTISDRKEAIKTALMMANKGDVVLIAGKGHENYQEIKGIKYHFDDKEIVKEIFNI